VIYLSDDMWYKRCIPVFHIGPGETGSDMVGYPLSGSLAYSIPLYIQIAEGLISQIEARELLPGDQLPSERELSLKLNVNRMTLRRALRVLESQGFIVRKHGVGTFVSAPKIDRQMDEVYRFTLGIKQRGLTPGARIISLEVIMLDASLAASWPCRCHRQPTASSACARSTRSLC
jgi:DNA-binding transcriptional regulator YhcF (GntR family)